MLQLVANLKLLQLKAHLPQAPVACIADQLHLIPVNIHLRIHDVHGLHIRIAYRDIIVIAHIRYHGFDLMVDRISSSYCRFRMIL